MTNLFPDKTLFYYWSGTGNSLRVASWFSETAALSGIDTTLLSIDDHTPQSKPPLKCNSVLGIVFPTHGFTAPYHIIKFAWTLPRVNRNEKPLYAFCAATRAGLTAGPFFLPGISGSATFIIALILLIKGFTVIGSVSIDMPSNWYSLHPIQGRRSHKRIIYRAHRKTSDFINKVLRNTPVWFTRNNLYEIIWGILLLPLSLAYLFVGRFFLAKLFFANYRCDGCGLCAEICSVKSIVMWGKDGIRPFWKYSCESCMRCAAFCPQNAIEAGHSWGVILYFITSSTVFTYLFSLICTSFLSINSPQELWLTQPLYLLFFFPTLFVAYYFFSVLLKFPFINRFFTYTTFTHASFWGRYREPDTTLKHLHRRNTVDNQKTYQKK